MKRYKDSELTEEAQYLIEQYLNRKIIRVLAIIGIINIGVLFGIYTFVSEKSAKAATDKAIVLTEEKLQGLTRQLDQLAKKTTDEQMTVLISLGEAKSKVDAINKGVLGLQGFDLKHVSEVTKLLSNSTDEIINIIESQKAINEIKILKSDLDKFTIESGSFSIEAKGTRSLTDASKCPVNSDAHRGIMEGRVNFKNNFISEPEISIGLSRIDIGASDAQRLNVVVTSVDQKGFYYNFHTWCKTVVHGASANWIAISK